MPEIKIIPSQVEHFENVRHTKIGNRRYIVVRHFNEKRDIQEAISTLVKNEAFTDK